MKNPIFLNGKKINGVSWGFGGFYLITEEGDIYDLEKGLMKTVKKPYDEKILVTTGNSLF